MIKFITISLLTILLIACNNTKKQNSLEQSENVKAKELMQGIWIDDESDIPLLFIKGDTIYYADSQSTPVYFKIIKDTLYTFGNELARYQIDKQTEYSFSFHSLADNIVKLHKSEDPNDSLAFSGKPVEIIPTYTEVTQKDSVVFYNGIRYRAYVYINPSKIKVVKTTYSEDGISMDNIYYDNIMHICIYEGRKCLFSSDITKQMLENVIPTDFLQQSILSEMNFKNVDRKGFHYQATVCIPESSVCNIADLLVSFDGKLTIYTAR
ncbi:DUF4738 domain-containing protein [Bacteroides salyersiae]|jgi:hypothetical protein|uniref:DUF4738 domain-containing protein n=1 Tax=Bacteroides salyersiae TaxID=291644 RepID=UPI001C8C8DB7|nr:DUF4738 domain-containing protein [Bacteroides salyersiae]